MCLWAFPEMLAEPSLTLLASPGRSRPLPRLDGRAGVERGFSQRGHCSLCAREAGPQGLQPGVQGREAMGGPPYFLSLPSAMCSMAGIPLRVSQQTPQLRTPPCRHLLSWSPTLGLCHSTSPSPTASQPPCGGFPGLILTQLCMPERAQSLPSLPFSLSFLLLFIQHWASNTCQTLRGTRHTAMGKTDKVPALNVLLFWWRR